MKGTLRECLFGVVEVAVQACHLQSETGGIHVPQLLLLLVLPSSNKSKRASNTNKFMMLFFRLLICFLFLLVLYLLLLVLYLLLLVSYLLLLLVEFAVVVGNFGPPYEILHGYEWPTAEYLMNRFSQGFSIGFERPQRQVISPKLRSALQNPSMVEEKISKGLELSRLAGPFSSTPFPDMVVSRIGIVPKKEPDKYRLIHHLSFPYGDSVNDGILREYTSVLYASIQDAIKLIQQHGPGCFLAKTDIESAFKIVPDHPSDTYWVSHGTVIFYYDKCLPFGCFSSCNIFETFSKALEWAA